MVVWGCKSKPAVQAAEETEHRGTASRAIQDRPGSQSAIFAHASAQLVAVDAGPRIARHVVERRALHEIGLVLVAEENKRRADIVAGRVAGDLPSLVQELFDRLRRLGGRRARRNENRDEEQAGAHPKPPRSAAARACSPQGRLLGKRPTSPSVPRKFRQWPRASSSIICKASARPIRAARRFWRTSTSPFTRTPRSASSASMARASRR